MKRWFYIVLLLLAKLLADQGYNTIYLMEFDNLKNDFTNSHLSEALPDLIKENYKFREDIKVEYAGDIRPYLDQGSWTGEDSIKGLIISGSFRTVNDAFYVEFEAYDIHNWKQLIKRQIFCPIQDIICVHDAFLISIESNISPFLMDDLNIDETILALERRKKEKKSQVIDLDQGEKNNVRSDINNLRDLNLLKDLDEGQKSQGQYGNRYYREFNLKQLSPYLDSSLEQNTERLINIFDQILTGPYDVAIGDISVDVDPSNPEIIKAELPIKYSVRSALAQELLTNLPHEKYQAGNENVILHFSNEDFIFDDVFMERLALMQFQMMPVIFFNNQIGKVQFIILDSWNDKFSGLKPHNITILWENQFKPLFALTPGVDNIQLTLDAGILETNYRFIIPYDKIGDYTKVTVKFMKESELEALIQAQFNGG